jgi:hypothetical protein
MANPSYNGPWNLVGTIKEINRLNLDQDYRSGLVGKTFEFVYETTSDNNELGKNLDRWIIHARHHSELTDKQIGLSFLEDEIEFKDWVEAGM